MSDNPTITTTCRECSTLVEATPPHLPQAGGTIAYQDDLTAGWSVLSYICGPCWERRPRTWPCTHCGGTGPISGNFCSRCHHVRPDPLPYAPDWDLIWKEERVRREEAEAIAAEWDREYPGWRAAALRGRERL